MTTMQGKVGTASFPKTQQNGPSRFRTTTVSIGALNHSTMLPTQLVIGGASPKSVSKGQHNVASFPGGWEEIVRSNRQFKKPSGLVKVPSSRSMRPTTVPTFSPSSVHFGSKALQCPHQGA